VPSIKKKALGSGFGNSVFLLGGMSKGQRGRFCNPTFYKTRQRKKRMWGQACNIGVPSEGQCILTGESPVMVEARAM